MMGMHIYSFTSMQEHTRLFTTKHACTYLVDDEGGGGLIEARLGHEPVEALTTEHSEHLLHHLELIAERGNGERWGVTRDDA